MSRDKQTEIANDLNMHCVSLSEQFCGEMSCNACISNWLYNAGYRKASDVAEEIFVEIEHTARAALILLKFERDEDIRTIKTECYEDLLGFIAELKKKYTESENNDGD
jgi:hypothetical protein